jgi:hypothetical protein
VTCCWFPKGDIPNACWAESPIARPDTAILARFGRERRARCCSGICRYDHFEPAAARNGMIIDEIVDNPGGRRNNRND